MIEVGMLKSGDRFVTPLTRRSGIVAVNWKAQGVRVNLVAQAMATGVWAVESKVLHPRVLVEEAV